MSDPCGCHATDQPCGCCAGIDPQTPAATENPPGLAALRYRIGTHASFLETMQAQLASHMLKPELPDTGPLRPLAGLTARSGDDAAIAMLDAWATVADVLTFYQERIANEGYLRTAAERRSILELARLVGYTPRPGVAASVYLAYELEQPRPPTALPGQTAPVEQIALEQNREVEIPAGSRAQSTPGPGELPQAFETSEPLTARPTWNNLRPRMTRPQDIAGALASGGGTIFLTGSATNLKPNDPLLVRNAGTPALYRVLAVTPDAGNDRTAVLLELWADPDAELIRSTAYTFLDLDRFDVGRQGTFAGRVLPLLTALHGGADPVAALDRALPELIGERDEVRQRLASGQAQYANLESWLSGMVADLEQAQAIVAQRRAGVIVRPAPPSSDPFGDLIQRLQRPPTLPPPNRAALMRGAARVFDPSSDSPARILAAIDPSIERTLYDGWRNLPVTPAPAVEVYALRVRASVFGHNAPMRTTVPERGPVEYTEWTLRVGVGGEIERDQDDAQPVVQPDEVLLDSSFPQILPRSWLVLERPTPVQGSALVIAQVAQVAERSRAAYGISAKGSFVRLGGDWLDPQDEFAVIRGTAVYGASEALEPAEVPIDDPVAGDRVELGDLYDGLDAGRWLIVAGERADLPGVDGVRAAELVMLAGVRQDFDPDLPGDRNRTTLLLATALAYTYKRATVTVYGNVVNATHGETRPEVLGSGAGSAPFQRFALRQPPLTWVSAPTPSGSATTLQVFVNDVRWHEAPGLSQLGPSDRAYITRTDDDQRTTVAFGNGERGARLPTGRENIRAVYRTGIGKPGNVAAGAITLLASKPLGVKGVVNPLGASGGADAESRDQARANAPLGVSALDRLVSVQDYEDFARTFAGIGKAGARQISDRRREIVHLTIAGADDIPIAPSSDLYRNLRLALHLSGDPHLPIVVALRELLVLIISAGVRIDPAYVWELLEAQIRAALLERFGFQKRMLGQPALLSDAVATIQGIEGVEYVDVDLWGGIAELDPAGPTLTPQQIGSQVQRLVGKQRPPSGPPTRVTAEMARHDGDSLLPAQLAVLQPSAPDTILLRRLP